MFGSYIKWNQPKHIYIMCEFNGDEVYLTYWMESRNVKKV